MKEEDIRPKELFEEYLYLAAEDAKIYFGDEDREDVNCPACGYELHEYEFNKHGFDYATCNNCETLYQTPRPSIESFTCFYNDSISSKYWAEKFFPALAESRRERIFQPRVERLVELSNEKELALSTIMDVGAGYGIFLEEWKKRYPDARAIAIEPSSHLAEVCRKKGLEVVEDIAENVDGYKSTADLVVCFEVLEHVYEPLSFIKTITSFVKPGGHVLMSTLGVDGFDIQVLWDKSNSVSPPHHINFLSVDGFYRLFKRAGLTNIDVLTPGVLDVDIIRNAYKKDPACLAANRFVQSLLKNDTLAENFQKFLVENKLSSHVWVLAQTNYSVS